MTPGPPRRLVTCEGQPRLGTAASARRPKSAKGRDPRRGARCPLLLDKRASPLAPRHACSGRHASVSAPVFETPAWEDKREHGPRPRVSRRMHPPLAPLTHANSVSRPLNPLPCYLRAGERLVIPVVAGALAGGSRPRTRASSGVSRRPAAGPREASLSPRAHQRSPGGGPGGAHNRRHRAGVVHCRGHRCCDAGVRQQTTPARAPMKLSRSRGGARSWFGVRSAGAPGWPPGREIRRGPARRSGRWRRGRSRRCGR
jgi:hypothetical protein